MNAVVAGLTVRFLEPGFYKDPRVTSLEVNRRTVAEQPDYRAALFDDDKAVFYADIYLDADEADCFREIELSRKAVVIGCGEHLHFIRLDGFTLHSLRLNGYFGHLYPISSDEYTGFAGFLLVCSASSVCFIDPGGNIVWQSDMLGIDGVIIEDIKDGVIYGSGEWDPPGGWQPFSLDVNSGRRR